MWGKTISGITAYTTSKYGYYNQTNANENAFIFIFGTCHTAQVH
jgi:hypothetical protein